MKNPVALIRIHIQVNDIRKLQHLIKKILKEIIFSFTAESGFYNQTLIAASLTTSGKTKTPSRSNCSNVLSAILPVTVLISKKSSFLFRLLSLIFRTFIRITFNRFLLSVCPCEPLHDAFFIVHAMNVFLQQRFEIISP